MKLDGMRISHYIPGRLRLHMDVLRGQPDLARQIESELEVVPGVRRVQAKAATGSVLLEYNPCSLRLPASLTAFGDALKRLFPVAEAQRLESLLYSVASKAGNRPPVT